MLIGIGDCNQHSAFTNQQFYSSSTGFVRSPTPSTLTVTVSPACSGPTPDGVPVEMMSPGSRVITNVMYSTRKSIGNISWPVVDDWRRVPFTHPSTVRGGPFSPVATHGPTGPKVSKPLARVYCVSLFWMSRAVTSFTHVTPRM